MSISMRCRVWLWSLLPDRCEIRGTHYWHCSSVGVRGNENVVTFNGKPTRMCDNCLNHWRHEVERSEFLSHFPS